MIATKNYNTSQIEKCSLIKKYENINQAIKQIRLYFGNKSKNEYKAILFTQYYIYANNLKYVGIIFKNNIRYSQINKTKKINRYFGTDIITEQKTGEKIFLFFNFKNNGQDLNIRKKVILKDKR